MRKTNAMRAISTRYVIVQLMKQINWNAEKNQWLMSERGVSFEDALFALQSGTGV
ncbi:hypothetical protein JCM39068_43600 [Desulfocastanea catecholica]